MHGPLQPSLFDEPDPERARRAREEGIGAADANADRLWRTEAREALRWCADHHETFTADEVWQRLAAVGHALQHEPSALGPVFMWAAKEGLIRKTGMVRPTVFARRHRDLTLWRSMR